MSANTDPSLQATTTQLHAIFRASSDLFFYMEADGKIVDYLAGKVASLYLPPESFLGKRMQDVLPAKVGQEFTKAIEKIHQADEVIALEYSLPMPEGERWYEARLVRLPESQILAVIRDITGYKQKEEQGQRQLKRLAALRTIDMTISASLDLHLTLNVVLEQVLSELNLDAAAVLLLNPQTKILEFAAGRGFRTNTLQCTRLQLGEGYAGLAALERRIIKVANLKKRKTDFLRSPTFFKEDFVLYFGVPLIAKGEVKGVLEAFKRAHFEPNAEWLDFLETLAGQAAIAIDDATMFQDLQRSNTELILAYDITLEGWGRALELRDAETRGHTQRVTELTLQLARNIGVNEAELVHIRRGALLHDIGKMGIPDSILRKPGPLSEEEWGIMRQHATYAFEMLSSIGYLYPALDIPRYHHEKWDGTGYPTGLTGEQIPLAVRIFSVVDVYDSLISNRPYRSAWSHGKSVEYIQAQAGKHFDPKVVEVFLRMISNNGDKG